MTEEINSYYQVPVNPAEICTRAFELMQAKQFDEAEKFLQKHISRVDDNVAIGLFHSALGVLYKLKGEPRTAWKHYQRAEKLIPDDPALKIITARLLIEEFSEFDQAIKRAKKILPTVAHNPVFAHQVSITLGLAFLGKGKKAEAEKMLAQAMENNFQGFVTTQNIDFSLVEALLRKNAAVEACHRFLGMALHFARTQKEETWVELITRMLEAFPKE